MELLTPQNITFAIGIIGILFTIYRYFRDPQVQSEKKDALLEQRFQWNQENTDKRFKDINENFEKMVALSQNHIHTVDVKVDNMAKVVDTISKEIVRLSTIIDERIPKIVSSPK